VPSPDRTFKALCVDYGGVLTTSMSVSIARFAVSAGVDGEALRALFAGAYGGAGEGQGMAALVPMLETGRLSMAEFDERLAEALSAGLAKPLEAAGLSARLFEGLGPDPQMIEAVRRAKQSGVSTALVTNTWGDAAATVAEFPDLFDVEIRSGQVGVRKPEPEIYRLTAERLGVEPEQCVFVDDIPANVEGARAVGMWGLLHRDPAITVPKLESLFGIDLS
jgi:epoxide hydrolase-like predicted phosphatase